MEASIDWVKCPRVPKHHLAYFALLAIALPLLLLPADHGATHLLIGERYLHLPKAKLDAKLANGQIEVSTDAFARQVTLERSDNVASHFDDNFFDMPSGSTRTIRVLHKTNSGSISVHALSADPVRIRW